MSSPAERWGIVGGGLLGMTLAHRLAQQGRDVTLFEGAPHLGGLASAWTLGDVVWDRHYHVTLLSDGRLRSLLAELGLEKELTWVETRTGFYTDGALHSMSNALEFLRFPPLRLIDKLRLGATILYASRLKDWKKLEAIRVTDWLRKWSGRHTFEKIWLPLLRAKLGENYEKVSAAFIWAIIARMYAARRTGLKKEMFGYVPGGYARILGRFAEVLAEEHVRIELRHRASRIQGEPAGGISIDFDNGRHETFDHVVVTTAAPIAADVCAGLSAAERSRLKSVQYHGVICASLLLKRPLANFYVTNITDSGLPFTAVIEMSALVNREQFHGNSLVYLPKYVTPDDPAFALSDAEIQSTFLNALARMYPEFRASDLLAFRVSRVRYVLAVSTLNYSQNLPPMTTSIPGLHLVNSAHILNGTLNANETIHLAETEVPRLLTASSRPALSVVIPVYNERATVEELLQRVQAVAVEKELIIVDDGSTDGTREVLQQLAATAASSAARHGTKNDIKIFFQDTNRGKGAALRRGFQEARGDIVLVQDADLEYDPQDYYALLQPIERGHADVVYGSRFLSGPHRVLFFWHYVGNRLLTTLSNVFTNLNLSDVWTCYKAFKREVLEQIDLREERFGFEPEVTAKIAKARCRVYEVPISYHGRTYGEGKKITWKDGFKGIWCIVRYNLLP